MKKIYIVTSGSYSDYGINAVFDSIELAQEYINFYHCDNKNDYNIEVYEVNKNCDYLKEGKKPFIVTFDLESCIKIKQTNPESVIHGDFIIYGQIITIYVWATDEEHAIKSAADLKTRGLALNKFKLTKFGFEKTNNNYTDNNILK